MATHGMCRRNSRPRERKRAPPKLDQALSSPASAAPPAHTHTEASRRRGVRRRVATAVLSDVFFAADFRGALRCGFGGFGESTCRSGGVSLAWELGRLIARYWRS